MATHDENEAQRSAKVADDSHEHEHSVASEASDAEYLDRVTESPAEEERMDPHSTAGEAFNEEADLADSMERGSEEAVQPPHSDSQGAANDEAHPDDGMKADLSDNEASNSDPDSKNEELRRKLSGELHQQRRDDAIAAVAIDPPQEEVSDRAAHDQIAQEELERGDEKRREQVRKGSKIGRDSGHWAGVFLGGVTGFLSTFFEALVRSFRRASDRLLGTSYEANAEKAKAETKEALETQKKIRESTKEDYERLSEREYGLEQRKYDLDSRESALRAREAELAREREASLSARGGDRAEPTNPDSEVGTGRVAGVLGGPTTDEPAHARATSRIAGLVGGRKPENTSQHDSRDVDYVVKAYLKEPMPKGGFAVLPAMDVWDRGSWADGSLFDSTRVEEEFALNGGRERFLEMLGSGENPDRKQIAKALFEIGLIHLNDKIMGREPDKADFAALWMTSQYIAGNGTFDYERLRSNMSAAESPYGTSLYEAALSLMDHHDQNLRAIRARPGTKALADHWFEEGKIATGGAPGAIILDGEILTDNRTAEMSSSSAQPDYSSPTDSDAALDPGPDRSAVAAPDEEVQEPSDHAERETEPARHESAPGL